MRELVPRDAIPRWADGVESFAAAAADCLVDEGLPNSAAVVTEVLPELALTVKYGATLQQGLFMTSSARYAETYEVADGDAGKMDCTSSWKLVPEGKGVSDRPGCIRDQIPSLMVCGAERGSHRDYRSSESDVPTQVMDRSMGELTFVTSDCARSAMLPAPVGEMPREKTYPV